MRNVDIKVFLISRSMLQEEGTRAWLDHVGAEACPVPTEISATEAPCGLAAKRCYLSFLEGLNPNVTKVRKDWHNFFENILKSGHGSVLEHSSVTVAIEGVSRVFTGEMNRHRTGVGISEGSMRYIRYEDIPWWLPLSLQENSNDNEDLARKKKITRETFNSVFNFVQDKYVELVKLWDMDASTDFGYKKKVTSLLRRIIPMGVATGDVWTMNFRALRHIIAMRSDSAAEEEIAYVMGLIAKTMVEQFPNIMCDFAQDEHGFWKPLYKKI